MARGGRSFNRGRGGRFNNNRGGGRFNQRHNKHFNRYKGKSRNMEGGRGEETSSQRKGFSRRDEESKTVTTDYNKNKNSNNGYKRNYDKLSSNHLSSDAEKNQHQANLMLPDLNSIAKNPKTMDNFFEAFNRWETHLVTECGKANIDNPYLTAGLHRSEVVTQTNGTSKITME